MHILLRGVLVFTSLLSISCVDSVSSLSLALPADIQETAIYLPSEYASDMQRRYAPLKALNKNAQIGAISNPEKSDVMYFAFEKAPRCSA